MSMLTPDFSEAKRFLSIIAPDGRLTFQTFDDDKKRRDNAHKEQRQRGSKKPSDPRAKVFHGSLEKHASTLAKLNQDGAGVFIAVNETDLKGRKSDNVVRVRVLSADFDTPGPVPELALEPHVIVGSSPGKWHVYWVVVDCPLEDFVELQKAIAKKLGSDPKIAMITQVMRVPGFFHCKGERFQTRIVSESKVPPYTVDDVVKGLNLSAGEEEQANSPGAPGSSRRKSSGDGFFRNVNEAALADLSSWFPEVFATARPYQKGFRVSSVDLGRELEEDISALPQGIQDFGEEMGKTPIDIVMQWTEIDQAVKAARWLCEQMGVLPESLGWERASKKSYEECVELARGLRSDSSPDDITMVLQDARHLNKVALGRVMSEIKSQTGTSLADLRGFIADSSQSEPDHLDYARGVLAEMGPENVLSVGTDIYQWTHAGVWKVLEPRGAKSRVQMSLSARGAEGISRALVDSVLDLLITEIHRSGHRFNIGPADAVNCLNGELVVNEFEIALVPHEREHYRTSQIPVEYDPNAQCPRFQRFLDEIFVNDPDKKEKVQALLEMIGFTLMTHCRYERFVILVGSGANGKSVLLSVLQALLGEDNVAAVQPSQFGNTFQRAHLQDKLANIVTEVKQGEVIDDASLKGIVSGEPSTVERKFGDPFVLYPHATCWFGTNHLPHTRDFSDALFRRALVVEFNETFKPELGNCDPHLKDALLEELPGILNLVVSAYQRAMGHGFTTPQSCVAAARSWRLEADQVAQFVEDCCEIGSSCREQPSKLYQAYKNWAQRVGIRQLVAMRTFIERLKSLGYESKKSGSKRTVRGLRLGPEAGDCPVLDVVVL